MKILVTGASGFVGAALTRYLRDIAPADFVRGAVRRADASVPVGVDRVRVDDLGPETDWRHAVAEMDTVVHTAARVHMVRETTADALREYRRVNTAGTLRLAEQAAAGGTRRFVFLSSIKVNGDETAPGVFFTAEDEPAPADPYGISKLEAEQGLFALGRSTGMEIVVIRPVLVYGPGVRANFATMMRWLAWGVPLPLRAIENRRSLLALDNLVDLIATCTRDSRAANQVFLVSDGEDLSTPDLLRRTALALGTRARLVPVPGKAVRRLLRIFGQEEFDRRLFGSLVVDMGITRARLGWAPPINVDEALRRTAVDFLQRC